MKSLIEQLNVFYYLYDHGQGHSLTESEISRYHARMVELGRIIHETNRFGQLEGYAEVWRVTPEQVGRILFNDTFNVFEENLTDGLICFVANVTVRPDKRMAGLTRRLKARVKDENRDASHICGMASHGKAGSFKIFKNEPRGVIDRVA